MENMIYTKCPHCSTEAQIELENKAVMVVFSCSKCHTPLMHYFGKTFEIDEEGMKFLSDKSTKMETAEAYMRVKQVNDDGSTNFDLVDSNIHQIGAPIRDDEISEDDIVDLMIALETNDGIDKFLNELDN